MNFRGRACVNPKYIFLVKWKMRIPANVNLEKSSDPEMLLFRFCEIY